MNKTSRTLLCGLVLLLVVLAPACRTKKTPAPVVQPTTVTATPPPEVPVVTPPEPTRVEQPTDFVKPEAEVQVDTLPAGISDEEATRVAQQKGYIQDAFFALAESSLSADAQAALTKSADWLRRNSKYSLLVEGHCDERGTEQYNLALGDHRANTAKQYLMTLGIDGNRIRTVSYGEERPFDPGHDESAWSQNRRAHLVLVGR